MSLNLSITEQVQYMKTNQFKKQAEYYMLNDFLFRIRNILNRRLQSGFMKEGECELGAIRFSVWWHWMKMQSQKPVIRIRSRKNKIDFKEERQYYVCFRFQNGILPNLGRSWSLRMNSETIRSRYTYISFIINVDDGRMHCRYRQVTEQKLVTGRWVPTM